MKSTAVNAVGYTGIVTLSQYKNGKQFILATEYNTGANPLFNFLADCLVGNFDVASYGIPTKVKLVNKQGDTCTDVSGFLHLYTNPEKVAATNGESRVRYRFVIPKTILENETFSHIRLYPNYATTTEEYAAEVAPNLDNINIASSSVLVVDWELVIKNAGG